MKNLFFILAALVCLSAQAQSVVVERYNEVLDGEVPAGFKRWYFGVDGGYSHRTAKAADWLSGEEREVVDKMRGGLGLGVDVHYAIDVSNALGLRLMGHRYSHDFNGVRWSVYTYYLGPSWESYSINREGTGALRATISLGYLGYSEKLSEEAGDFGSNLTYSNPGTMGYFFSFGYDFFLENNMTIGPVVSFSGGSVDLGYEDRESLSAIDIGVRVGF